MSSSSRFVTLNSTSLHGNLTFRLNHVNVSFANAIRRTILSDIPTVVFDKPEFLANETKINNEMIIQRLAAIPIHIQCHDSAFLNKITIEVKQENTQDTLQYVTTQHFEVVSEDATELIRDDIFPLNELTGQYIDVLRLLPHLSDQHTVEKIHFTCKLRVDTASNNYNYNVVSTCYYTMTLDEEKIQKVLEQKQTEWRSKNLDADTVAMQEADFNALERHRYVLPNSFEFVTKSIGVYTNQQLMNLCCQRLLDRLEALKYTIDEIGQNCFRVVLKGEDYTLGKMIEYCLHNALFENSKQLLFCGFLKDHPHDTDSIIKLTYKKVRTLTDVNSDFVNAITSCSDVLIEIKKAFV